MTALRTAAPITDSIHMDLFGKEMDGLTETGDKAKGVEVVEEEEGASEEETEVEEAAVEE